MRKKKKVLVGRRFGYFTDTHFTQKMKSRKDDYLSALLSKMHECFCWFDKMGCEFVLFGGDFFDKHREMNWDLIHAVRKLIIEHNKKIYYIAGNHDELGYRVNSIHKSNLGFLDKILDGRLEFIENHLELDWIDLYACHANENVIDISNNIKRNGKASVLVSHCLLSDDNKKGNIHINAIRNKEIDLVLSGDLHDGYDFQMNSGGIYCYNPGSLLRKSCVDKDREPKVACFSFEETMGIYLPIITEFIPQYNKDKGIFNQKEEIEINIQETSTTDYVKMFREFKRESKNIFEVLKKIGKERKIEEKVINLISEYENKINF